LARVISRNKKECEKQFQGILKRYKSESGIMIFVKFLTGATMMFKIPQKAKIEEMKDVIQIITGLQVEN